MIQDIYQDFDLLVFTIRVNDLQFKKNHWIGNMKARRNVKAILKAVNTVEGDSANQCLFKGKIKSARS